MEKENKKNYGFWLDAEVEQLIDRYLEKAEAPSRSAFVEKAVRNYAMMLENKGTFEDKVLDTVKGFEKHMAAILFKVAGEQAIMNLMLADREFEIDDKTLREYRNNAYELIRKRKGMISFYDAIEDARGVAEFTNDDYDRVREKNYPWEK